MLVDAGVGGFKRALQSHDIDLNSEDTRASSYLECVLQTPSLDDYHFGAKQELACSPVHLPLNPKSGTSIDLVWLRLCNRPWFVF